MYERNDRPDSARRISKLLAEYRGKNPYPHRILFINPDAYTAESNDDPDPANVENKAIMLIETN